MKFVKAVEKLHSLKIQIRYPCQKVECDLFIMLVILAGHMSDLYGLKLEPMPNKLVNYGVTNNGIAVIELTSNSAGQPLDGPNDRSPNTYTHEMMRDIDEAVVKARFNDDVTCIVLTGNGASFFSAGASIQNIHGWRFCQPPRLVLLSAV